MGTGIAQMQNSSQQTILEVENLNKSFGGVHALINADFCCRKGEVHALIGENGAGKSTFVKVICAALTPDSGRIFLDGKEYNPSSPMEANKLGIAAVFQELSLINYMTVAENIFLGNEPKNHFGQIDLKKMHILCNELFSEYGFTLDSAKMIRQLPLAQQQMVEILKALVKEPKLLILDEATSALSGEQVDILFNIIRKLSKQGKSIIFISHRMEEVNRIADYATVFRDAKKIISFPWASAEKNKITQYIVGRKIEEIFPEKHNSLYDETALSAKCIECKEQVKGIDIELKKGEILGIAGLAGHGQIEFLRALYGAIPLKSGTVELYGKNVKLRSPKTAIKKGVVLITEDRKHEGLLLDCSVRENTVLIILNKIARLGIVSKKLERKFVDKAIKTLKIKTSGIDEPVSSLSGGNQQKVVIGKSILSDFKILLLADPTRGIDIGTKAEIYQLIRRLADSGIAIILYSTELSELVGMCNRVVVFSEGKIKGELKEDEINEYRIIDLALGINKEAQD